MPQDGAGADRHAGFAWAVAACMVTTALALPLRGALAEANLILIYLLAVMLVTMRFGRKPGILASFLAVLAYDVFMVPPYFSLTVDEPQYLLTFAIMLAVSLLLSHLTANLRFQALIANQREQRASALFHLSKELSGALSKEQISDIGVRRLNATFGGRSLILFPSEHGALAPLAGNEGSHIRLADTALIVARLVYEREVIVGYGEGATIAAGVQYFPLRAPMRTRGVLVLVAQDSSQRLPPEQESLLQACAAQIALAIERVHYSEVAHGAMLDVESERLRNSLLSAISHDIRTPLTAIVGLSSTLAHGPALDERTVRDSSAAVLEAATRMDKLVTNLLDMARLHDGAVKLNRQWQLLEEVVGSALAQMSGVLAGLRIDVSVPATLPLLDFDAVLLERVMCNLIDSAAKHGAAGGALAIAARLAGDLVEVAVDDQGPGIAAGMEQAIFAKFARGDAASSCHGAGLGLSICAAIIKAHGGTMRAENRAEGGARFVFTLPLGTPPGDDDVE